MSAPLTFLFTDVENSSSLWEQSRDAMRTALARHDELLHRVIESHGGRVVKDTGDGVMAVFESPSQGIEAALEAQRAIVATSWPEATGPLRVRMGLHTGESHERDGDFFGSTLNRAARVMGIGHGGQILVSEATKSLIDGALPPDVSLAGLGEHRLKGIVAPATVYQLKHPDLPIDFPPLRSLSVLQHNLPVQLSSFVGREQELSDVRAVLANTRLLTLLGSGGMGKTRLMLQIGEEVVDQYADGVWMVELAPVSDPARIPERIAATFRVQEQPGRPMADAIVDFLRHKHMLLLLDNAEHLVTEAAAVAQMLLEKCPRLEILATSREPLLIPGETTLRLSNLSLPGAADDPDLVAEADAVRLFLERARTVRPDFAVTGANSSVVAEIVRRLDGIPLALELAAARLRMLSVNQIAERLEDRFRLLTGGRRTAVPRQQTLQATIAWSWDLLDEIDRLLLARLAVFSGGWSLEAAQAVTSDDEVDEYEVLDTLEHLVDKSLVVAQFNPDGEARYGMLESIRSYATDRLADSGTVEVFRRRHAHYYSAWSEEAAPQLLRGEAAEWARRMTADADNLRTALKWLLEHEPDAALRMGGVLFEREALWMTPREARSWLEPAVDMARERIRQNEAAVDGSDFVRALTALGSAQGMMGDPVAADRTLLEAIDRGRRGGDMRRVAFAVAIRTLQVLFKMPPGWVAEVEDTIAMSRAEGYDAELATLLLVVGYYRSFGEEPRAALPYWREGIEIISALDNHHIFMADRIRVFAAVLEGDIPEAKRQGRIWVDNARNLGARRSLAQGLSELAHVLRRSGELAEAKERYREAITIWQEVGQLPAVAHELECLAYIATIEGEYDQAASLIGAAAAARDRLDAPMADPTEVAEWSGAMEQLAEAIGVVARNAAIDAGRRLSLDDVAKVADR